MNATVIPTPAPRRNSKFGVLDIVLWLSCWPWAIARVIGRKCDWTAKKSNWIGVGSTVALLFVVVALVPTGAKVTSTSAQTAAAPAPAATAAAAPAAEKPAMTSGQENALKSAQSYLDMSGFSKAGLIEQLSSSAGEGFSKADATFAANHAGADWNQEAAESAQSYLDMGGFSKAALIEQLSSSAGEEFTPAQAQYAVSKVY